MSTADPRFDETPQTLRLNIDGKWSADEMARSFSYLRDLYNLRLMLLVADEDLRDLEDFYYPFPPMWRRRPGRKYPLPFIPLNRVPLVPEELAALVSGVFPGEELQVRRVKYGSEGFKDLVGFAAVVGHIKDFLIYILERKQRAQAAELQIENQRIINDGLRLENARKFAQLRVESVQADEAERRQRLEAARSDLDAHRLTQFIDERQEFFIGLAEQAKITSVDIIQ